MKIHSRAAENSLPSARFCTKKKAYMRLTIDNFDNAGARGYTANLNADAAPRIQRKLNRPSKLTISLVAPTPDFIVPASGARIVLERGDGQKLFTGYVSNAPDYEYLGWGERGPMYVYSVTALSDEFVLDRKFIAERAPFAYRAAGDMLKQLANDLAPGVFDTTAVEGVETLTSYAVSQQLKWSDHAARIAMLARAAYRAQDGKLNFSAVGKNAYKLDEASADFCPDALKLNSPDVLVNDLLLIGHLEPAAYVKDYFLGDGYALSYYLSHTPYLTRQTLMEDEYKGTALDGHNWTVTDPAHAISVSGGKLRVSGGTGADGATTVTFVEQVELGGALMMQHGEVEFSAASNGLIGGLYDGATDIAHCVAGFRVTASGSQSSISTVVNGVAAGTSLLTQAGHRYAVVTRISGTQPFRTKQAFHSSQHTAGNARGGTTVSGDVHLTLEVHDIDPNNAGTLVAASTVLYDGVITSAPAYCIYALVNSMGLQCTLSFTRLMTGPEVEVASTLPNQAMQMKLVGALAEGAHCQYSSSPAVRFFSASVPAPNEAIRVTYRTGATAMARITDPANIASKVRTGDDGVRAAIKNVASPAPRTSSECEDAALALLDDATRTAWSGEYRVWSDFLPQHALDIFPGDSLSVNVPSRTANFTAIVREVEIDCMDTANDRAQFTLKFANDAAEPLSFESNAAHIGYVPDVTATTTTAGSTFISDLPQADVTAVTSTTLSVKTGVAPPTGGGFEVRRSDYGWSVENDRNLVGRFTAQTFTLPRLSSSQTYYLRQYDAGTPPKYSRYSTALHIDYPL
jgi:hypothetical protein